MVFEKTKSPMPFLGGDTPFPLGNRVDCGCEATHSHEMGSRGAVEFPPTKKSLKERILEFRFPALAKRLAKELELSLEDAEMLVTDMTKFLFVSSEWSGKKAFYPPPLVDEAWHTFIIFTMDYEKFCHEHFGRFIHHVPFTDDNKPLYDKVESARPHAEVHFGALSKFWEEKGKDCSKCGDCSPVSCEHR